MKNIIQLLVVFFCSGILFAQNESVTIGTQIWMKKNLDVDHYRNGDIIPQVTDPTEWANLTTGAWCYYNNDSANGEIYGKLYNWYAVNDPRGLAPDGWHVSQNIEWNILLEYLGWGNQDDDIAKKMRETSSVHWKIENENATNESGFTGLPGGWVASVAFTTDSLDFYAINKHGFWWTSTEFENCCALWIALGNNIHASFGNKSAGYSVRCIKD